MFIRRDEVEAAWTWLAPLMKAGLTVKHPWRITKLAVGGPDEARNMLKRHHAQWHEDMSL